MENKNEYRLTLKFKENDPVQREIISLLKGMGRRKSKFISMAVKYYIDNYSDSPISKETLQELVNKALLDLIQSKIELNLPVPTLKHEEPQKQIVLPNKVRPKKPIQDKKPMPAITAVTTNPIINIGKDDDYAMDDDDFNTMMDGLSSFGYD